MDREGRLEGAERPSLSAWGMNVVEGGLLAV